MAAKDSAPIRPNPPTYPSPGRQVFHLLIAVAGWVLFCWWWWLVINSVSREAVRFTVIFVLVTAVVVVAVTTVWWIHNLLIFRRRGARTQIKQVTEDYSRDRLGRSVHFADSLEVVRKSPVVQIRIEHQGKVYRAAPTKPGPASGAAAAGPARAT